MGRSLSKVGRSDIHRKPAPMAVPLPAWRLNIADLLLYPLQVAMCRFGTVVDTQFAQHFTRMTAYRGLTQA